MSELIRQMTPVARKPYNCGASEWLLNTFGGAAEIIRDLELESDDAEKVLRAESNGWKIVKGQKYVNQTVRYDGEIQTFRAIPEMHDLCLTFDIYDDC